MAIVTKHDAGEPSWFELTTTDQTGANRFYTGMFGWSAENSPIGPDQFYTMFDIGGERVAAAYSITPEMKEQNMPPHWGVYFSTPAVDAWTAKVTELGGTVITPPFDVMEYGRMSVCEDPQGAAFSMIRPVGM